VLYDPARHEPLSNLAWDETRARETIERIVHDTHARFSADHGWPLHPRDAEAGDQSPATPLYHGACGVIWALDYLRRCGACSLHGDYTPHIAALRERNMRWLTSFESDAMAPSYLMGETGFALLEHALRSSPAVAERLAQLIDSNLDNPTRELMWGAPGTMLAALFLHRENAEPRWATLFRRTARQLRSQLEWSERYECHYWTQDMYGTRSSYLDAVHGFVATALPLIAGRDLLDDDEWLAWEATIARTVRASATFEEGRVNWRVWLYAEPRMPMLMQFCHGAPGFVICLAGMPGNALDDLLIAAGETTWEAGPLRKGSNLCHGTAGNGYAFLKLHGRTGEARWLERARAFAMHAIAQMEQEERRVGRQRYSLWTGDPGLAIYLWDCIRGSAAFPTLDVFLHDSLNARSKGACAR